MKLSEKLRLLARADHRVDQVDLDILASRAQELEGRIAELEAESESRYKLNEACISRIAELEVKYKDSHEWNMEQSSEIAELTAQLKYANRKLGKYTAAEANEYGQSQQRIAKLEAENQRLRDAIQNTLDTGMERYIREALHHGSPNREDV